MSSDLDQLMQSYNLCNKENIKLLPKRYYVEAYLDTIERTIEGDFSEKHKNYLRSQRFSFNLASLIGDEKYRMRDLSVEQVIAILNILDNDQLCDMIYESQERQAYFKERPQPSYEEFSALTGRFNR